jgi:4-amino-4-deoxy-L-arabinose transferase-like glycosyltransferase
MNRQTFAWGRAGNQIRQTERWIDGLWIGGLFLAALLLMGINLGTPPLGDWQEATVALVAREIWRAPDLSWRWLYLTLNGVPYFEHPPLLHWLIAWSYEIGGVNEWTTRLPGALLSAISVPLLYNVGREIFPSRLSAIFSGLVYLTLLSFVRYGRMAMPEGAMLCFGLLTVWCVLRSRRDLRFCLGAGFGLALLSLSKGIVGLFWLAMVLGFLAWDTPRLLTSGFFWSGLILGGMPAIAWYAAQWFQYGQEFFKEAVVNHSLRRIWASVEERRALPWYYLGEILLYAAPWLLFFPYGLRLAWEERNWSWGKLVLVWAVSFFVAISLMVTKLPWYILPVYPPLALAAGAKLAETWNLPSYQTYPRVWRTGLMLLALCGVAGSVYFGVLDSADRSLSLIFGCTALTMLTAAFLVARRDSQFILVLFWGMYVSLLLFMTSPHWLWKSQQSYPVKQVAGLVLQGTPTGATVYTSFAYERPSLNFYSDRTVTPASNSELKQYWQDTEPYFLLNITSLEQLHLESVRRVGTASDWVLVTKEP